MRTYDCRDLIRHTAGAEYEREYDEYIAFFRMLATSAVVVSCSNVPRCWAPFVRYLGHAVETVDVRFGSADFLEWESAYDKAPDKRRVVEMASAARPELVHALYYADTEWPCPLLVREAPAPSFPVTVNASFYRPEVRDFQRRLQSYMPSCKRAVLVPCSAAKPYPSALHVAVGKLIVRHGGAEPWDLIVVSGTLGLAPEELWPHAPQYDAGLPNHARVEQVVRWYFTTHRYERVVCFSDFYGHSIHAALERVPKSARPDRVDYVLGYHWRDTYENLMLPEHMMALAEVLAR